MTTPKSPYDEAYYMNGPASGKSNYVNYSWMEERTMELARRVVGVMSVKPGDSFLDFGCARGFLVKAMRRLGVEAWGVDVSEWAISNCDLEVAAYVFNGPVIGSFDHIWMKDVAEHIEPKDLRVIVEHLLSRCRKSMMVIVPLSFTEGGHYVREEDNKDSTHFIRWPLESWLDFFQSLAGERFQLSASWDIPGLKPTSYTHLKSCGFIRMDRVI